MDQPKVTVVLPIYNVEKYLDRCVESVTSQTYGNLEIILVDDGSPDGCPAMCDNWAKRDHRIKVVHKANAGLGMARNTGLDNATGEYIFFFDSDDYVSPAIVEKCVGSAEENSSDAVIFGYCNAYEDGREEKIPLKLTKKLFQDGEIRDTLLPGMYTYKMGFGISAWGKMYRVKTLLDSGVRFRSEREIISEDAYFALEFYSQVHTVSIVDDYLYFYYKRGDSLSRAYKPGRQVKNDQFIHQSLACIAENGITDKVKNHIIARYHMYTVAAIKQLQTADIPAADKERELNEILKSEVLHKTVSLSVLKLHKWSLAILFFFVKMKCYPVCKLLISLKK